MSCPDCGCNNTTINCNCPEPSGIEGAKLDNIISAELGGGQNISGIGYTFLIYTNTTSNNQVVYVQTNMNITAPSPHNIDVQYIKNGIPVGTLMEEDLASTKTDFTHFLVATILAPTDTISINVKSNDAGGNLIKLTSFIYKYNY